MSSLAGFIARLTQALDELGLSYMFVGSIASSVHGSPRSTQDVDIVVTLSIQDALALVARFPDDRYYVSVEAAREAVLRRSSFNIIDFESGWKADLLVTRPRDFSRTEMTRRQQADLLGVRTWVASPEDTILAKLEWAKLAGGSARQRDDVIGIVTTQGSALDLAYLSRWAAELGLEREWAELSP